VPFKIPATGTATHFADAMGAARRLSPSTRAAVRAKEAVHVYPLTDARGDRRFRIATVDRDAPRATHPVLLPHPRTGEPVLFVGQMQTDSIVGLDEPSSEALLAELWSELYAPESVYTHEWRVGDLVIWDNRCTLHRGRAYDDATHPRDLRRVTTKDVGSPGQVLGAGSSAAAAAVASA
jgi:alpha-ketoglutarate-dependent taurine dioxygenase